MIPFTFLCSSLALIYNKKVPYFKFAVINKINSSAAGVGFIFFFKYRGNIMTDMSFKKKTICKW